jgi:tetratricopeptide (TPR) repeat protein
MQSYNLNRMSATRRWIVVAFSVLSMPTFALSQSVHVSQDDKQAAKEEAKQQAEPEAKYTTFAAHLQKAKEYLDEKRPDLAIPELQAAAAIDPENVETQGNLGVLLYFQGKSADAIPHLRAAVERQPGMVKIQGLLGLAELHAADSAQGQKDLEAAFPLITEEKFKVEIGLELVGLYTQSGDLEQAGSVLAQLRKAAPDNAEVLYASYRIYSDLSGESMLALSLAAPDSAQMHQLLAHEETKQGNINGAISEYRKAIAINPHLPGIHFELAELLRTSQDAAVKRAAEEEYRLAVKENPQDEKAILRIAEINSQYGNQQASFKGYSRAVELQPGDADAKLGLAKILIEMNQPDKALKLLEETVQLEPTSAVAHYRLGTQLRKMGRADDAKREMELYTKYKDMKEKLQALYKDLQRQLKEIEPDELDTK